MQLFILLLFWLTFGALTAQFARNKGRDPRLWFIIGVLLGVGGVIIALFLPKKEQKPLASSINNAEIIIEEKVPFNEPSPISVQQWYYLDPSHQQFGPVYLSTLQELYQEKHISEQTYIWTEGMESWKRLKEEGSLINMVKQAS